ncbi:hypothetical protein GKO28_16010 [Deefgea sp. CFH1-16]|nr:hypothetical protein [Deefgea sp. CFH1-16]
MMVAKAYCRIVVILGCLCAFSAQATPLDKAEAQRVLARSASAAEAVSYTGNYIYQSGENIANYKISHAIENGVAAEHRELLDGEPREYLRVGDKVSMYPAQGYAVQLDRRYTSKLFPNHLPDDVSELLHSYGVSKVGRERVVGRETTIYQLDPLDAYRYPQRFWVDDESGLILKWLMMGMRQEMVQSFSFTQIQVGGKINQKLLKPIYPLRSVQVNDGAVLDLAEDKKWRIKPTVPGFKLIKKSTRSLPHKSREVVHYLFSDGAVTLSVFVEPMNASIPLGLAHQGAIHLYARQVDQYLLSCLGEVPAVTVERFAKAYTLR